MTYGVGTPRDFMPYDRARLSWKTVYQSALTAATLSLGVLVGALFVYGRPGFHPSVVKTPDVSASAKSRTVFGALVMPLRLAHQNDVEAAHAPVTTGSLPKDTKPSGFAALIRPMREESQLVAANTYGALLDPNLTSGGTSSFADSRPLGPTFVLLQPADPSGALAAPQVAEAEVPVPSPRPEDALQANATPDSSVPVPMPRPAELAAISHETVAHEPTQAGVRQFAKDQKTVAEAAAAETTQQAATDNKPSFFDKLFGNKEQQQGTQLAYASPDEGGIGNLLGSSNKSSATATPGAFDRYTAVYNIAAHTVYLPSGQRLEAHSGLGAWMDDPHHVNEKMRGATPPAVYELQPREALFHGVPALRLLPVGGSDPFGRTGLLAHTYMLGPNGQSNGCVSFRDYAAFLRAYQNGDIKRIAVIAGL